MPKRTWPALALALSLAAAPALRSATLPRKAPEFAVQMPDGKEVLLSSYKGKAVVLVFILTTCSHCQTYTRLVAKMQTEFGGRGLQCIESAIDQNAKTQMPGFIRAFMPPFPVGYNDFDAARDFLQHAVGAVLPLPAVAFIDRAGMIVAQYKAGEIFMEVYPEQNLRNTVQSLLSGEASQKVPPKKAPAAPKKK